jgi:hypothetical protein
LAAELQRIGHWTSHRMVAELLHEMEYSLQANRKTLAASSHPDRDAQFHHINAKIREFQQAYQPMISVDTKKKELVGDFKNQGRNPRPKGDPEKVRVHDFVIPGGGRAAPYGIYDVRQNAGWVSVGVDHDTAAFAAQSIRRWWESMGAEAYPRAAKLLLTVDSGGSNGARVRLWKLELLKLADETGLAISVCHPPPEMLQNVTFCYVFAFFSVGRVVASRAVFARGGGVFLERRKWRGGDSYPDLVGADWAYPC